MKFINNVNNKFKRLFGKGGRKPGRKTGASSKKAFSGRGASSPPDTWWRRWLWYGNPKRFLDWWFTKPGALAALRISGVMFGLAILAVAGLFLYFAKDLPSPGQINAQTLEQTTRFYDRTGKTLLYEVFGDENRTFVPLDDMGPHIGEATIAIEDRNFYRQGAFSSLGIIRATINNVLNRGDNLQGGSTITQQYVKNALLTNEQTVTRKIKELILSIQIEQLYDKDDILELYLNEIGYGAQAYGVEAASKMFFSKEASELTLDEAAMLAALPQAPTFYSPYGKNREDLLERMHAVLDLMVQQGYITREEAEEAKETDTLSNINDSPHAYRDIKAPHFVLMAQEQLEERYGPQEVTQGGLEVITTLDLKKQRAAEKAVKNGIGAVESAGGNNASLVANNPDNGQVLAMVGSRNFNHPGFGAYNAATAHRQPGSSFKPYVYSMGFETKDWGPGSIMYDVRTDFGNYAPNNFDNSFRGNMTVRSALAESRNIPAVKMLYIVGLQAVLDRAEELGITTLGDASNYGLSLVLGSGEVRLDQHVNGYSTFANGGIHHDQTIILKVTDPKGVVLEEWKEKKGERVMDEQIAYLISDILSDDNARAPTFGYNNANLAVPGHTVAIKTGTTDDQKDGWMMGYTRSLTVGVWAGHNQNEPMHVATSNATGPIFTNFMKAALNGKENQPFKRPNGIKSVTLDRFSGDLASDNSKSTVTDIFPSHYEPTQGQGIETVTIDTISGKRATECTPDRAKEEVTSYGLSAEIPRDDPAFPRWNPPVVALAKSLGLGSGGSVPEEKSTVHKCDDEKPRVTIRAEEPDFDEGDIEVSVTVTRGRFKIKTVEVSYNGQVIKRYNKDGEFDFTYKASNSGSYKFEALVIDEGLYGDSDTSNTVTVEFESEGESPGNSGFLFPDRVPLSMFSPLLWRFW